MSRFAVVPTAVLRSPHLSATEKLVLTMLATYADEEGYCWPSVGRLVTDTSLSESAVRRGLQRLQALEVVTIEARYTAAGDRDSNGYWITGYDYARTGAASQGGGVSGNPRWVPTGPTVGSQGTPNKTKRTLSGEHPTTTTAREAVRGTPRELAPAFTFPRPEQQVVYETWRRAAKLPAAFDAALKAVIEPPSGGQGVTLEALGTALLEMAGNGEAFNVARLRGYVRRGAAPIPVGAGAGRRSALDPSLYAEARRLLALHDGETAPAEVAA